MGPGLYVRHPVIHGRSHRILNVIDESNRDTSHRNCSELTSSARSASHGIARGNGGFAIRLVNRNELRSAIFSSWCEEKGIEPKFSA